eukprot:m.235053 g.235053  ORF g.235053 m.235053 type:complete len:965 (-) comp15258_c5_seq2:1824-4718(-)
MASAALPLDFGYVGRSADKCLAKVIKALQAPNAAETEWALQALKLLSYTPEKVKARRAELYALMLRAINYFTSRESCLSVLDSCIEKQDAGDFLLVNPLFAPTFNPTLSLSSEEERLQLVLKMQNVMQVLSILHNLSTNSSDIAEHPALATLVTRCLNANAALRFLDVGKLSLLNFVYQERQALIAWATDILPQAATTLVLSNLPRDGKVLKYLLVQNLFSSDRAMIAPTLAAIGKLSANPQNHRWILSLDTRILERIFHTTLIQDPKILLAALDCLYQLTQLTPISRRLVKIRGFVSAILALVDFHVDAWPDRLESPLAACEGITAGTPFCDLADKYPIATALNGLDDSELDQITQDSLVWTTMWLRERFSYHGDESLALRRAEMFASYLNACSEKTIAPLSQAHFGHLVHELFPKATCVTGLALGRTLYYLGMVSNQPKQTQSPQVTIRYKQGYTGVDHDLPRQPNTTPPAAPAPAASLQVQPPQPNAATKTDPVSSQPPSQVLQQTTTQQSQAPVATATAQMQHHPLARAAAQATQPAYSTPAQSQTPQPQPQMQPRTTQPVFSASATHPQLQSRATQPAYVTPAQSQTLQPQLQSQTPRPFVPAAQATHPQAAQTQTQTANPAFSTAPTSHPQAFQPLTTQPPSARAFQEPVDKKPKLLPQTDGPSDTFSDASGTVRFPCPNPACSRGYKNATSIAYHLTATPDCAKLETQWPLASLPEAIQHGSTNDHWFLRTIYVNQELRDSVFPCLWKDCSRGFSSLRRLLHHVSTFHILPQDDREWYCCYWQNCKKYGVVLQRNVAIAHLTAHYTASTPISRSDPRINKEPLPARDPTFDLKPLQEPPTPKEPPTSHRRNKIRAPVREQAPVKPPASAVSEQARGEAAKRQGRIWQGPVWASERPCDRVVLNGVRFVAAAILRNVSTVPEALQQLERHKDRLLQLAFSNQQVSAQLIAIVQQIDEL